MRKFGLVLLVAAAAITGTACCNTGFDGSWASTLINFNGAYASSNNGSGAATLPELSVAVSETGSDWWSAESLSKYNACTPQINVQLYKFIRSGFTPTWGRYFDTGEVSAHPFGDVYSYVRDDSGDTYISGPEYSQVLAGDGGYTSAVAFSGLCGHGTGGVNGNGLWVDTLVARQITPLGGYFSTGLTDNLSFYMLPGYANDAVNHDVDSQGAVSRLPLATRIEILKTIDVNEDIVRTVLANGKVTEDIKARLTALTVDGQTFVPSQETSVVVRDFSALAINLSDPGFKALAAWVADRLQADLDAGIEPTYSVTINDSLTISSQELHSLLPDMHVVYAGQLAIDRLRAYAGTLDRNATRRARFDRRFDDDMHADVDFGVSKGR